jgi:superfamily I DNA and/or RNA helicase
VRRVLEQFRDWARTHPRFDPKTRKEERWEVACLAFYVGQEDALRTMLREVTGQRERDTRFELPNIDLVCGTVDRFQGREADVVLLSLRNISRVGFLDSPNRLNVAITRARRLLLVVGNQPWFAECEVEELRALADRRNSPQWPRHDPQRLGSVG